MDRIALFNHKGGVGKTTLTVNVADALVDLGKRVLIVDADPQCNVTSFFLPEDQLDALLSEAAEGEAAGDTLWSAVRPVAKGIGPVKQISPFEIRDGLYLAAGDVLLSEYEQELPAGWTDAFAQKERGYNLCCALSDAVDMLGHSVAADVVLYDVGPNVGALNRVVLLDTDYFITPVAADLFSLRALTTVGRSIRKWLTGWKTVRTLASDKERERLLHGQPKYLGYVTSAFKVSTGKRKAIPHSEWEAKIAPRVSERVIDELRAVDPNLIVGGHNKLGDVRHFHSLADAAQKHGVAIGKLQGLINSGHNNKIRSAAKDFTGLAKEILKRMGA